MSWRQEELETTIDSVDWAEPLKVIVTYELDSEANELGEIEVWREDNREQLSVTDAQMSEIIDEIWDDVAQNTDYPF